MMIDDLIAEIWKNRFIWLSTQRNEQDLKVVVMAWWFKTERWWVQSHVQEFLAEPELKHGHGVRSLNA